MNIKSAVVKKPNVLVKGFSLSVQLPYRSHIDSMVFQYFRNAFRLRYSV